METPSLPRVAAVPSLMLRLRESTAEQHRLLENALDLTRLDLSRSEYREALTRFYGYWSPWERLAAASLGSRLQKVLTGRFRANALCGDLRHLGLSDAEITSLPQAQRLPNLESEAEALGSMYVIEGSTLGGQLLVRHFVEKMGIAEEECSFFRGYGTETGAMWREFSTLINERPRGEESTLIAKANETFHTLREWLCRSS